MSQRPASNILSDGVSDEPRASALFVITSCHLRIARMARGRVDGLFFRFFRQLFSISSASKGRSGKLQARATTRMASDSLQSAFS